MTRKHSILIISILIISISVLAQKTKGYTIDGTIPGLKDGSKISMKLQIFGVPFWGWSVVDSTIAEAGKFHLSGFVKNGPRFFWLVFADKICQLYIDNNDNIQINYDSLNINPHTLLTDYLDVKGSQSDLAFQKFIRSNQSIILGLHKGNNSFQQIEDSIGFDPTLIGKVICENEKFNEEVLVPYIMDPEKILAYPFIAYSMLFELTKHASFWIKGYNQLNKNLRESYYGTWLKGSLKLCVGQQLPSFSLPDKDGKMLALDNFVGYNKLTLVHFWATNSAFRKDFDNELRKVYKMYHAKGLEVVGISSDSYLDQWNETLTQENYIWPNVIDAKGRKFVDTVYHELGSLERENTTNVLLDKNGKIIAWDVTGPELQWYLWKNLVNN